MFRFAAYVATGQAVWRRRGVVVLKWTVIAGLGFFAVLILERYPLRLWGDVAAAIEQQGWEAILPPSLDWSISFTHAGIIVLITLAAAAWPLRTVFKTSPVHR